MTKHATVPAGLSLTNPEGQPVELAAVLGEHRLTVVQLVRYFGCLPCQEWLVDFDGQAERLAARGVGAVAVGGSADYQAQWLRDERGVSIPLLLDPEQAFRDAVGAGQPLGLRMLNPRGASAYVGSLRRGYRPQKVTRDTVRSPGVVILDAAGVVRWQYVGKRIGDYPTLATIDTAIDGLG